MKDSRPNETEEFDEGSDCDCHDYPPQGPLEEDPADLIPEG